MVVVVLRQGGSHHCNFLMVSPTSPHLCPSLATSSRAHETDRSHHAALCRHRCARARPTSRRLPRWASGPSSRTCRTASCRPTPTAAETARLAADAGLGFRHIPVTKAEAFSERVVGGTVTALGELDGPVLAHCASGLRSAIAWAAAASRGQPVDAVLQKLAAAGLDLEGLRHELEDQHDPGNASPIPRALDVGA